MEWWHVLIGLVSAFLGAAALFVVRVAPAVQTLLLARAERVRADSAAVMAQWREANRTLQGTIDHLRQQLTTERDKFEARLDALEKEVRDCEARSARLQQQIDDLRHDSG